jgi:hypothetical protein
MATKKEKLVKVFRISEAETINETDLLPFLDDVDADKRKKVIDIVLFEKPTVKRVTATLSAALQAAKIAVDIPGWVGMLQNAVDSSGNAIDTVSSAISDHADAVGSATSDIENVSGATKFSAYRAGARLIRSVGNTLDTTKHSMRDRCATKDAYAHISAAALSLALALRVSLDTVVGWKLKMQEEAIRAAIMALQIEFSAWMGLVTSAQLGNNLWDTESYAVDATMKEQCKRRDAREKNAAAAAAATFDEADAADDDADESGQLIATQTPSSKSNWMKRAMRVLSRPNRGKRTTDHMNGSMKPDPTFHGGCNKTSSPSPKRKRGATATRSPKTRAKAKAKARATSRSRSPMRKHKPKSQVF